jgi:hypothetical protein
MESDRSESEERSKMSDDYSDEESDQEESDQEESEDEATSSSEDEDEDEDEKPRAHAGRGRAAKPKDAGDGMRQTTLLTTAQPKKKKNVLDDDSENATDDDDERAPAGAAAGKAKASTASGDSRKPARDMRRSIAAEANAMLDCAAVNVPTGHAPAMVEMVAKVRADFAKYSDDQFSVKDNYTLIQNLIAMCRLKNTVRSVKMTEDERREDGQLACQLAMCTAATACELAPVVETLRDNQAAYMATLNTLLQKLKGVSESMAGAVVVGSKRPREEASA